MATRRALSTAGLSGAAAIMAAAGGATWYYASRITQSPSQLRPAIPLPDDHVRIIAVAGDRVVLEGPDPARPGTWGVVWDGGYGQVGPVTDVSGDPVAGDGPVQVTRPFQLLAGTPEPGSEALLDPHAYPPEPDCLGLPYDDVTYAAPCGDTPAWLFCGDRPTWAILVHGRSARRQEAFRAVPTIAAAGLAAMAIAYRNDADAPASPDRRSHLGATEWQDVEAAAEFALANGAQDLVLVGYSMGGACVAHMLQRSELAARVRGVVLEAPVLNWSPVIRRAAVARGLPPAVLQLLLPATMALAGARHRIDWRALDAMDDPEAFTTPTLLIHGSEDPTVPVELADAFADTRADIVTYLRVEGAGHVRAWNTDRDAYESSLRHFLAGIT